MRVSLPNVSLNIKSAKLAVDPSTFRVLFIGQMLSGTATAGTLVANIDNVGGESALFGAKSHLANMIRNFRRINPTAQVDAIGYADAGGATAATGTLAFTGPATSSGTLLLTLASVFDGSLSVAVNSGDTASTVATNVAAAINAQTLLPFTASASTGTVTVTCAHAGTIGNNATLEVINASSMGLGCTITGMASGATDPTITGFPTLISGIRYKTIVFPGTYSRATLNTEMKARFNVTNDVMDGVAICTRTDTATNLISNATDNNASLVIFGNPLSSTTTLKGGLLREMNENISAQVAAIRTLRLTTGALITDFVSAYVGPKDIVGGPHISSLPYFNTPLANLAPSALGQGFTMTDMTNLTAGGISYIANNAANNGVLLGEVSTTYLTDSYGNSDPSFHYLNYVDTLSHVRAYLVSNLKLQYAQTRLSQGATTPGYSMATQQSIAATIMGFYNDMANIALVPNDSASLAFVKANLSVTLTLTSGTVTVNMLCPIIVQLRTIIGQIQLSFTSTL